MHDLNRLYLDHAATTPMLDVAREAMVAALSDWSNPSSPHREGRAARARLEQARADIKVALDWEGEIIFTSGATEAIQIALGRTQADLVFVSPVEHDAIFRAVPPSSGLAVDANGVIDLQILEGALANEAATRPLVAVQHVNNETGVIQPVEEIAAIVRAANGLYFCDCSQSAGKIALPNADLIAISAHKLGGPPGVGALLVKNFASIAPSGGQEQGYRGGTENLPAILGFAAALSGREDWIDRATALRASMESKLEANGAQVVAGGTPRLATIGSYRMPDVTAQSQLIGFDSAGIAVSAGSACSSGTLKTSKVLLAMGMDEEIAKQVIRVSFGPETNGADIDRFVASWEAIKNRALAA